jgi:hypothetical protein
MEVTVGILQMGGSVMGFDGNFIIQRMLQII